jgi:hypothetical protein
MRFGNISVSTRCEHFSSQSSNSFLKQKKNLRFRPVCEGQQAHVQGREVAAFFAAVK